MKTKPIYFFVLLFLYFLPGCDSPEQSDSKQPERKPNILFLFTDDQSFNTINAMGNKEIHTPNMDRLFKNGTAFTNAYNMGGWHGAICAASRSMMISGRTLWPAWDVQQAWRAKDSTALANTWGRIMARNGYDTYMSGKWHVAAAADYVFDQAKHIRPGMPRDTWPAFMKEKGSQLKENMVTKTNLKGIMPIGYHRPNGPEDHSWSPSDTSFGGFWEGGIHWSEVLKNDALEFIATAAKKEDPFFMYLAFNAPHDPRQAPQSFIDQYPLDKISLPENWLPEYPWKDSIGNSPGLRDEALAPYPRTPFAIKTHLREYYAIISHLDVQIGLILDALEDSGQMDNTYIFFTADHGLAVGQHGLLGKQNMFDHSIRVPLVICGPDIAKGSKVKADVYLQDIMPTSLELAGISKPDFVAFNSLLDLAHAKRNNSHYEAVYGAYIDLQRMIRKDGYKLILYPRLKKILLFDLENDPLEKNDLAGDQQYAEKVKTLFKELTDLQKKMEDPLDIKTIYPEIASTQF